MGGFFEVGGCSQVSFLSIMPFHFSCGNMFTWNMISGTFFSTVKYPGTQHLNLHFQGLKPLASTESPALIFGTPTKLASDSPAAVSYLGKNKVPDLQKLFQVRRKALLRENLNKKG